jgi:hypothetical protein
MRDRLTYLQTDPLPQFPFYLALAHLSDTLAYPTSKPYAGVKFAANYL